MYVALWPILQLAFVYVYRSPSVHLFFRPAHALVDMLDLPTADTVCLATRTCLLEAKGLCLHGLQSAQHL